MMCNTRFPKGAKYTQEDLLGALEYWDMGQDDDLHLFDWV